MKDLKIFTNNIDEKSLKQIEQLSSLKAFKNSKIRIMPDVHSGKGCVIGFTAKIHKRVIPNVVGVDIGCGVLTVCLGKIKNIDLQDLDRFIRENIPCGREVNEKSIKDTDLKRLLCYKHLRNIDHLEKSLGTLGGGNHFIEVDKDDEGNLYLMVHTGSRNIGKQVCEYYQNVAINNCQVKEREKEKNKLIKKLKKQGREKEISEKLEEFSKRWEENKLPKDLCYLEKQDYRNYLKDMAVCQDLAFINRLIIAAKIAIYLSKKYHLSTDFVKYYMDTPHNYIDGYKIVRKGAVAAYKNDEITIPLNMRDGAIIARGKGNKDWNYSAPHGAGRVMSRSQAKQNVKLKDYKKSMEGIYSTSVNNSTIDECPMAYKNAQDIIDNIKDTVKILRIIKPIYNFKAGD